MTSGPEAEPRPGPTAASGLVEHFFRREYGRLVAVLTRKVGVRHLDIVEDAVQAALLSALTIWTAQGRPDDPGAWLYRVAHNNLMGDLRRTANRRRILEQAVDADAESGDPRPPSFFAGEVADDMLRMLFVCCDEAIPRESRLVLALKTLCGFSTAEIALRLFTSEANVYKRLARARARLREAPFDIQTPPLHTLRSRLPSVFAVLYLLFNEGYLSAHAQQAIRRELCDEAVRLATLLAEHSVGAVPETFALLALMHLHAARLGARCDGMGALVLLEEQDRTLWDRERMRLGAEWLERSARRGGVLTIPRRSRHRRRALLRALIRGNAMEGDIRPLRDVGAHRPVAATYHEPGGRRRRVAGARSRTRVAASPRAAGLAGGLLPVGRRTRRPASARRKPGDRTAAQGAGVGLRAHGGRAGPPPAQTGNSGLTRR